MNSRRTAIALGSVLVAALIVALYLSGDAIVKPHDRELALKAHDTVEPDDGSGLAAVLKSDLGSSVESFDVAVTELQRRPAGSADTNLMWRKARPKRRGFDVLPAIVLAPRGVKTDHVAHSRDLNPRSRPLSDKDYKTLSEILELYREHLGVARRIMAKTRDRELRRLRNSGQLIEKFTSDQLAQIADEHADRVIASGRTTFTKAELLAKWKRRGFSPSSRPLK